MDDSITHIIIWGCLIWLLFMALAWVICIILEERHNERMAQHRRDIERLKRMIGKKDLN